MREIAGLYPDWYEGQQRPPARPAITTTAEAEAAVDAACALLRGVGVEPTRILVSVAMYRLLELSNRALASGYYKVDRRLFEGPSGPLRVTVTSTNPDAAFVTAYAE